MLPAPPPCVVLPINDLGKFLPQLPPPLLLGDFNSHHTVWGCVDVNSRGRLLENFILRTSLCILNTGAGINISLPSGSTSVLDLSIASPQLVNSFEWTVDEDPLGSDHFPIWLHYQGSPILGSRPQRWNLKKADWKTFEENAQRVFGYHYNKPPVSIETFTSLLLESTTECVPRTAGSPRRIPVPWWTQECRDAIRTRRPAFRIFKRDSTTTHLINFKRARALARRTILEAMRSSWCEYVDSEPIYPSFSDLAPN